jgi:ABC-type branched-subunit amino acid transport system ATPase component
MAVPPPASPEDRLEVRDLTKDFGGLRAVNEVSFALRRGEILGLIGPNGSGKTTTINLITGLLTITNNSMMVGGREMAGWPPYQIARSGLARTFQVVKLFKDFTVAENVEVAAMSARQVRRAKARTAAEAALDLVGITRLADLPANILPQGEERRVEIARALATDPSFLLLDEPGAGLNDAEIEVLLPTLHRIREQRGCGILIVDHDMRLIMRLCDRIHVLNYGRTIAEGRPDQVRREPAVIEAYLGAEEGGHGVAAG